MCTQAKRLFCSKVTGVEQCDFQVINPLTPASDENETPLYIITTCSNIQVMRIKDMITMRCLDI